MGPGDLEALLSTWKQTQKGSQNGETKKQKPYERIEERSRNNVVKQSNRCRVQDSGHKDAQGTFGMYR